MQPSGTTGAVMRYAFRVAVIAAAYCAAAALSRALSIPPGFATAIWPAAGLALAVLLHGGIRWWPGVFLGSLLFNINPYSPDDVSLQNSVVIAVCCASAASMQAIIGSWLVRRNNPQFSTALELPRDILGILICGGLIACLVSSSLSIATLHIAGLLRPTMLASSWLTWWVGDVIGIAVFTPVALLLLAPRPLVTLQRKIMVSVVMASVFAVTVYLFVNAREYDRQGQVTEFNAYASDIAGGLEYTFDTYLDILSYTRGFFAASDDVTLQDFRHFTDIILQRQPQLGRIAWSPLVTDAERSSFEKSMSERNGRPLTITDYTPQTGHVIAGKRDFYFPALYIAPPDFSPRTLSLDLYFSGYETGRKRHDAIELARATGQSQITELITFQSLGNMRGFLAFTPVSPPEDLGLPPPQRRLSGMISILLPIDAIMQAWARQLRTANINLRLTDITVPDRPVEFYNTAAPGHKIVMRDDMATMQRRSLMAIGGRQWELMFTEAPARIIRPENWILWMVLIGGMSFTATLSAFILTISGRAQIVQRLVEEKTHEVAASRDSLEKANTELKQQYLIIKEKEETFRLAMEHASTGMALVMTDGRFMAVNQALCDLLGYSADELMTVDFQKITHPDDLEADLANVRSLLSGNARNYRMQKRYLRRNGQTIWALLSVSLVRDARDKPLYFISQIHDITEIKTAEFERQQLIDRLIDSNTELEKFAYVASHDMQEPLRMMASFSKLLREEQSERLTPDGSQYLKVIIDSAERMQVMVSDLLEYARVSTKPDHSETVNTELELDHVKDNLATALQRTSGEITYDILPNIRGNAIQFCSLLQNIISNSLKYQPPGNQPKIHISSKDAGDFWEFIVTDNGIGIAAEDIKKIFEPFTRLHPWQQYQGTGIGLAICRKIVESQGGRIWATSSSGQGSSFHFTFPKEA